jgi:hypothetical protein
VTNGLEQARSALATASQLPSGTPLTFPQMPETSFTFPLLQTTEIFAIACTQPLQGTWKAIWTSDFRQSSDRWSMIPEPLAMAKALLNDLAHASAQPGEAATGGTDSLLVLRSHAWATLSL